MGHILVQLKQLIKFKKTVKILVRERVNHRFTRSTSKIDPLAKYVDEDSDVPITRRFQDLRRGTFLIRAIRIGVPRIA